MAQLHQPKEHSATAGVASGGWAAYRVIRGLLAQFLHDARLMGPGAWRRWAGHMAAGLVLVCLATSALTVGASRLAPAGLDSWDERALAAVLEREPVSFSTSILLESPGNLVGMGLLVWLGVALAVVRRRPMVAASLLASYWLGTAVLWAGWLSWSRERPDLVLGGVAAPGLHAFPSGHALHMVASTAFWPTCGAGRPAAGSSGCSPCWR